MKDLEEFRQQLESQKKSNMNPNEMQIRFNAERSAYETSIFQLRGNLQDLESQLKFQGRASVQQGGSQELELLRKSKFELESKYVEEISELKNQIEFFKNNNYDVKQISIKFGAEKAADQSQIKQLKQMNENFKAELEKLYELMNQRKAEYDNLQKNNEGLRKSMVETSKQLQIKGSNDDVNVPNLKAQISELEAQKEEYRKSSERSNIELARKNRELVDKIQELDVLKLKYEEALTNYQGLSSKLLTKLMTDSH
jgi:chromosome segregation ATPase